MSTILVTTTGSCGPRCYDAEGPDCTCVCSGENHGQGRERALAQSLLRDDVIVLPELPLHVVQDQQTGQHPGRACARCGGRERLRAYVEGRVCLKCRRAALVLVEA